ncbi:MAG: SLC26A/SulP transporter family protein [Elusimicrobiota bacterium]
MNTKHLSGDLWGGITAMLVALPSAIAFGVLIYSVLGPEYAAQGALAGLLGAVALGIIAPLFGAARGIISAPCAPAAAVMSALAASLVLGAAEGGPGISPEKAIALMTVAAVLSALLQTVYGSIGLGRLIKFIPFPVVSGYLSGVAVLIFIAQIPKLLGLPQGIGLSAALHDPGSFQWPGIVVGLATIAVMSLADRVTKKVPAPIIALVSAVLVYFGLGLLRPELMHLEGNPLVIGSIGSGGDSVLSLARERLDSLFKIGLVDLRRILVATLTLSVLLSIDTLKTGVVLDALTRERHDSNREIIGQGLGNLVSAFAGGMPGAGTMGPTLINVTSGGKTRLSGMIEGVMSLLAFLLLGRLIAWIPIAALSGILIVVAFRMFDWKSLRLARHGSTRLDFCVIAAVVVTAATVGLIAASGIGVALAISLFIRDQVHGSVIRRKLRGNQVFSKTKRLSWEREFLEKAGQQTAICELQGNLFFGTTDQLQSELEEDLKDCRFLIVDLRRVASVDYTAVHLFDLLRARLREADGLLLLSGLTPETPDRKGMQGYLDDLEFSKDAKSVRIMDTLDEALEWTEDRLIEESHSPKIKEQRPRPLELSEIELFREIEGAAIDTLSRAAEKRSVAAGEKVFDTNESEDKLYLIRSGTVRVFLPIKGRPSRHLATFRRGDFFGDLSFLDYETRSAEVVALKPTELYVLSRSRFNEASRDNPVVGVMVFARLARAIARRLRRTDADLRALEEN